MCIIYMVFWKILLDLLLVFSNNPFFFFQYIVIARSNEIKSLEHLSEAIIDNDGLERIFLSK